MAPSETPTLPRFIAGLLARPQAVALAQRRDGRTVTLGSDEVHARAAAVAFALRERGLARADRIAIVAANCVDWLIADFGILYAGCVVVPAFAATAPDQLRYILAHSEAKLVFTDTRSAAAVRAAGDPAPPLVLFESAGEDGFDAFVASGARAFARDPHALANFTADADPDELAVLIYTSGTTGTPKGVMLSHRNLVSNAVDAFDPQVSGLEPEGIVLSVLPLAHIFEHTNALGYRYNAMAHYITTPEQLLDDLRAVRPAHVAFVPRIFDRLIAGMIAKARAAGGLQARLVPWALATGASYERAIAEGPSPSALLRAQFALARALVLRKIKPALGLDRLHFVVSGSAPLHKDVAYMLAAMGIRVCEGYGETETAPVVTVNRPDAIRIGSVGPPIRNVEVKIARDGEILVRGPNVMLGYYKTPRDEQPFTADGWLRTGDIGRLDAENHLFITDRKREVFKSSGGEWISPARIESAVKRSVFVAQVMALGDDRPHPVCLIVPNWGLVRHELGIPDETSAEACAQRPDVRALMIEQVRANTADLAPHERIERIAILPRDLTVEDGELSPTLKVRRRVVAERYAALIDQAYAEDLHVRSAHNVRLSLSKGALGQQRAERDSSTSSE